jgi:hypothetical protein
MLVAMASNNSSEKGLGRITVKVRCSITAHRFVFFKMHLATVL